MKMPHDELLLRQQRLLTRSAQLRLDLGQQAQAFKRPLDLVDQARAALRWLAANPVWPLGAVMLLAVLRPRGAITWGGRLWWTWNAYKQARAWITNQG